MMHTILLVDDDPNVLAALSRALRKEVYQVATAGSSAEAISILSRQRVDLVVSDEEMPGGSGSDLLARVRRSWPETARFILTGRATVDTAVRAINDGAVSRFLIKPCDPEELRVAIRQVLRQRDLEMQARRLYMKVKKQEAMLAEVARVDPALCRIERDADGVIVLDDPPEDHDDFMRKVHEVLGEQVPE